MRAGQHRIQPGASHGQSSPQFLVDALQIVDGHEAFAHTGLVGHHDDTTSQCCQFGDGVHHPVEQYQRFDAAHIPIRNAPVQYSVPVEEQRPLTHPVDVRPFLGSTQTTEEEFMQSPVSCAVIGAGYWGPHLVRNLAQHPRTRLRWVIDIDPVRARALTALVPDARWSTRLDDALADDEVDAVAIATPAATHHALARRCLEAGRHVLVEKPLATSVAEGHDLVTLAAHTDRVLMCDHTYCYTPAARHLQAAVASGHLGDVHYVDSVRVNLGLVQPDVDVVWDLAPHDLSLLQMLLPPDRPVLGVAAHGADPLGTGRPCVAHLHLELGGGALAHLHVNWLSPTKVRTLVVGGSRRTAVWDDLDPVQRVRVFDRGVDLDPASAQGDGIQRRIAYRVGDMTSPALGEREALSEVVGEFADSITQRRAPLTDGASGLWVLQVLEAARASLDHGGVPVPVSTQAVLSCR